MRVARWVIVAAMLAPGALLPAACSNSNGPQAGEPQQSAAATIVPSASSSGSPGANPFGAGGTASPTPFPANRDRPCEPEVQHSVNSGVPGGTYIRAVTRPAIRWGPGCEVLNAGDKCEVYWTGAYTLAVGTEAHLRFQAWARGQSKPFKELTAGPLPPENNFREARFPVVIPKGVKEVSFRIVLLDTAKVPVAISDAFSYLLNCKPETK
jgi:hypothetical protein